MRADISLLFNFFVAGQRIRRVLGDAMASSGMKPDEYAVYSLLFEKAPLTATEMSDFLGMPLSTVLDYLKGVSAAGHLQRIPHPDDGRAVQLRLSASGLSAFRRAHHHFEAAYRRFVSLLALPEDRVKLALAAIDDAAQIMTAAQPARVTGGPAPRESRRSSRSAPARRPAGGRGRARERR